jgi:DNA-binding Lrp family transcriptional regulator
MLSIHELKDKCRAFIFIDVAPGKERNVVNKLMKHKEVMEAHLVTGQHDILVVCECDIHGHPLFTTPQQLVHNFIIEKIRNIREVRDTNTIVPVQSLTKK